ncbi:ATPase [Paenibacillus selenitireducens]|uniref:ATPase n=1 Tax=Paenibacillus selenitireducens TaxID=1324314 RepID=A0A1T2X8P3_9BACL|nr:SRPBCC domain-containing protein [Paenibacillus selenitireducens]OPA76220.1 ATPase [Paenibacillus selenitireducens]
MSGFDPERKPVGLTASAGYQVGVRRTFALSREQVWSVLTSAAGMQLWLGDVVPFDVQAGASFESRDGLRGTLRIVKPYEQIRMAWQRQHWNNPSTLQIRLIEGGANKTTVSFHQEKLQDPITRAEMKEHWDDTLSKLLELGRNMQ